MYLLLVFSVLMVSLTPVLCQTRYEPIAEKLGSCPPQLPAQICSRSCYSDSHCLGIAKCCPTSCGGFICSRPVTTRKEPEKEKPGICPAVASGRWVCSSSCTSDSDCRGTQKCCKNRCGALVCQKPDIEVFESIEIPFNAVPEDRYNNMLRNPYPYYLFNNNN